MIGGVLRLLMTGQSLLDQGRQHNDFLPRVEQRGAKSHES